MTTPIRYISTRGQAPELDFEGVVLAGLAEDGGLYVPSHLPVWKGDELKQLAGLDYISLAEKILRPFVGASLSDAELRETLEAAYARFHHAAYAPLVQIEKDVFVLELFHGPTLAFKDFALQWLGQLVQLFLRKRGQKAVVLGATSGDTGSAAIEAFRDAANTSIVILHPHGRPSEVQRRQMTTVEGANVHNLAIQGTFDDCQDIVKQCFSDAELRAEIPLIAVNSINFARVLAQTVYYFYASLALNTTRRVHMSVPTGNFGDIYAGYLARSMGAPIGTLIIATNRNDILARCVATGEYRMESVHPTHSPSMDIQIASNFERYLFDLYGRDAATLTHAIQDFRKTSVLRFTDSEAARLRADFAAASVDDAATERAMIDAHHASSYLMDPHTAVGYQAAKTLALRDGPMVVLATAHPAKFPEITKQITGYAPPLPVFLDGLLQKEERMQIMPSQKKSVVDFLHTL